MNGSDLEAEKQLRTKLKSKKFLQKKPNLHTCMYPNVGCPSNEMTGVGGRQMPDFSDDAGAANKAAITAMMATA